jgi:transmembrane sensor
MNPAEDIKLDEIRGTKPRLLTWAKAIIIPAITLILVGSLAIFIGRHRQKPVDWVNIHAVGRNRDLKLPDGSKVILREGSSVTFPSDFGRRNRNLQLRGDAYFQVLNNPAFPFSILTTREIRANGAASFFISSRDSNEQVLVEEGRLLYAKAPKSASFLLVRRGEKLERTGSSLVRSSAVNQNYFAWQSHRLVFDHAPLSQVAKDICNYYDVNTTFDGSIDPAKVFLTSSYNNCSIDQVLQDIAMKTGVVIEMEGSSIVIYSAGKIPPGEPDAASAYAKKESRIVTENVHATTEALSKKKKKKWWKFWERK